MLIWLLVGLAAAIALAYRQAAATLWLGAGLVWLAAGYLFNAVAVPGITLAAEAAGLSPEEVTAVTTQYADAQIMALKVAFASIALFSLLALWYVQSLPKKPNESEPAATTG